MLSFSISYPDLIKFPYFADPTQREDRGAKADEIGGAREGGFTDNSCCLKSDFWTLWIY
jgi:hypothetical protein